jgi:adenylate cyclase
MSERYDRQVADIVQIEDEICGVVLARLGVEIGAAEQRRVRMTPRTALSAWDAEAALERNPNPSTALLVRAYAKAFSVEPEGAVPDVDKAVRLSPLDPYAAGMRYAVGAIACLRQDKHHEAIRWGEAGIQSLPGATWSCIATAVAYGALGQSAQAREVAREWMSRRPDFTISNMLGKRRIGDDRYHAWFVDQLSEAGIPR